MSRLTRALPALFVVLAGCASGSSASAPPSSAAPRADAPSEPRLVPPGVPDALKAPDGEQLARKASARGVQIYECQPATGDGEGFAWKLSGPEADLTGPDGGRFGRHYAGPTWEATDGSKVVGELRQKVDAPDGQGIPWLLLHAKSTEGSGALAGVTSIQRVATVGGKSPPTGCDAKTVGSRQSVPYQAVYYFYVRGADAG